MHNNVLLYGVMKRWCDEAFYFYSAVMMMLISNG